MARVLHQDSATRDLVGGAVSVREERKRAVLLVVDVEDGVDTDQNGRKGIFWR